MAVVVKTLCDLPPIAAGHSRIFLCRHGETDANSQNILQGSGVDAALNAIGKQQAAALAESLAAATQLDVVASSTLVRSVETADIVTSKQPLSVDRISNKWLGEMFYGSLEGLPISETQTELRELSKAWAAGRTDVAVGGDGESPDALLARAQSALWGADDSVLAQLDAGKRLAIVAHSTFNRAVLSVAMGKGLGRMFDIPQDNACVNVLDYEHAHAAVTVVAFNIVPESLEPETGVRS